MLQVEVMDDRLHLEWQESAWKTWTELHDAPEFKEFVDKYNKVLEDAKKRT